MQTNRNLTPPSRVLVYVLSRFAANGPFLVWRDCPNAYLEQGFKEATDAAIAEGEQSVEEAMAAGPIYIEKAKSISGNALAIDP